MHINWQRVGRILAHTVAAVIKFFARLLRDAWLDLWKGSRPLAVKIVKITIIVMVVYVFIVSQPELAAVIFQFTLIIWALYYFMLKPMMPKKKKRRRK